MKPIKQFIEDIEKELEKPIIVNGKTIWERIYKKNGERNEKIYNT